MLTRGGLEVRLHMFLYIGSMYVYIYTHIYCRCIKTMYLLCLSPRHVKTRGLGGEAPRVFYTLAVCVCVCLEAFAATEFNEIFWSRQSHQGVKVLRRFGNQLCSHLQGVLGVW